MIDLPDVATALNAQRRRGLRIRGTPWSGSGPAICSHPSPIHYHP
ncbi:hypothetical protein [Erwinia psidii]|nr:hypothetical protein [Erwinia psidii]